MRPSSLPSLRCINPLICGLLLGLPWAVCQSAVTVIDPHAAYPEGPLWRDGRLLYVEYAGAGIKSWDGSMVSAFWKREHCGASGLVSWGKDHLLVACYDENVLVELDARGQEVRMIKSDSSGKGFTGPNDFAPDGAGGVYFSASGAYDVKAPITGTVLHLKGGAGADADVPVEVATTIHYSNGLTVAKDGKSLLVAEGLAGRILSFPIAADGSLGPRTVWARMQDLAASTPHADAYNGPDGLKLGPDGNYYIAQNGSGRLLVVTEDRKLVRVIKVPTPFVTNMSFGAAGSAAVYITGAFEQWKAPYPGVVYRWTP